MRIDDYNEPSYIDRKGCSAEICEADFSNLGGGAKSKLLVRFSYRNKPLAVFEMFFVLGNAVPLEGPKGC